MPRRVCLQPGCTTLTQGSRCTAHTRPAWHTSTTRSKHERGYDRAWEHLSLTIRREHPTCQVCGQEPSTSADHIIPLAEGGARLDRRNIQAIGDRCKKMKDEHDRKRGIERAKRGRAA